MYRFPGINMHPLPRLESGFSGKLPLLGKVNFGGRRLKNAEGIIRGCMDKGDVPTGLKEAIDSLRGKKRILFSRVCSKLGGLEFAGLVRDLIDKGLVRFSKPEEPPFKVMENGEFVLAPFLIDTERLSELGEILTKAARRVSIVLKMMPKKPVGKTGGSLDVSKMTDKNILHDVIGDMMQIAGKRERVMADLEAIDGLKSGLLGHILENNREPLPDWIGKRIGELSCEGRDVLIGKLANESQAAVEIVRGIPAAWEKKEAA